MTQSQLDREVADATGESIKTIAQRGFNLITPASNERDREPLVVNWDQLESQRDVLHPAPVR